MIVIVAGMPRNGKGIYAMDLLEQYVQAGRPVYTNIELLPACPYYDKVARIDDDEGRWPVYQGTPPNGKKAASKDYGAFWHYVLPGSAVIVDEIDAYIDATEWTAAGKDLRLFHKQHGKLGLDLIYICQHVSRVVSYIRQWCQRFVLCEWNWRSMRMFQRLVPYIGVERAMGMSRFLRSEFVQFPFTEAARQSDVAIPYREVAAKYFQPGKAWYRTEQLLGDTQHLRWMTQEHRSKYGFAGSTRTAAGRSTDDDGRDGGSDASADEAQAVQEIKAVRDRGWDDLLGLEGVQLVPSGGTEGDGAPGRSADAVDAAARAAEVRAAT